MTGGKDSHTGEEVPECAERVNVTARSQWEARTRVATQGSSAQGS